ncbi:cadherin-like beta sandwich domain-containing protein [Halanaerobiaceae bacterium Z-7014]|uniref:Cadherin-like beta sandwich domain-containing protein n=1 Tax=Halonatronomonas betaini TaxID=2778430 RepID=A0A931AVP4_9FIRM|nr:GLUG motif-containing protein [Halonatronomonas betaini]MBF8436981.1 cadherin-like beta sandwich domain-containing protein [Halonatronomonas betaini]
MNIKSTKKFLFMSFIIVLLLAFTGCDSVSDNFGSSGSYYDSDIRVVINNGGYLSEDDLNDIARQLRLNRGDELIVNSIEDVGENEPVIYATIKNLRGENTVEIGHQVYGSSSRLINNGSDNTKFTLDGDVDPGIGRDDDQNDNGDENDNDGGPSGSFVDVSVEKSSMADILELTFVDYDQLGRTFQVFVKVLEHDEIEEQSYIKTLDDLEAGDKSLDIGMYDDYAYADIKLLDSHGRVLAKALDYEFDENTNEIEFDVLEEPEDFEESEVSALASIQSRSQSDYLAKYTMDLRSNYQDDWVDLELASGYTRGLPSRLFTINHIGIDRSFDFDDVSDSFNNIFDREHEMSGSQIDNMDIYYRLNDQTDFQNARTHEVAGNQDEIIANLTSLYLDPDEHEDVNAEGDAPYARASAAISLDYEELGDDEQYIYTVNVHGFEDGLAGIPAARRFAVGSPTSDAREFGNEIEHTSGSELSELTVYILGMDTGDIEGDGDEDAPYKIDNAEQLSGMLRYAEGDERNEDNYYILTSNINMDDVEDWHPIGSENFQFQGHLDGQNHVISNLTIDRDGRGGLFGEIGEDGLIKNLRLSNFDITGDRFVGTLASRNMGKIKNVTFADPSTVTGNFSDIGGLVGQNFNEGSIINSEFEGTVDFNGDETARVGGFVGSNIDGTIEDSYAYIDSVNGVYEVGGFVGFNNSQGIRGSSATGNIDGFEKVGGFVGLNEGLIENSSFYDGTVSGDGDSIGGFAGANNIYDVGGLDHITVADANVNGIDAIGGVVGTNRAGVNNSSVNTVDISGEYHIGGLVGYNREDGDVRNSDFTGGLTGIDEVGGLVGRNTAGSDYSGDIPGGVFYNSIDESLDLNSDGDNVDILIGYNTGAYGDNTGYGYLEVAGFEINDDFIEPNGELLRRQTPEAEMEIIVYISNTGDINTVQDIEVTLSSLELEDDIIEVEDDFELARNADGEFVIEFNAMYIENFDEEVIINVETNDDEAYGVFTITDELNDDADLNNLEIEIEDIEDGIDYIDQEMGVLNPEFGVDDEEKEYEVFVSHKHDYIDIIAELSDELGRIDVTVDEEESFQVDNEEEFRVNLNDPGDETEINILVTAENSSVTEEYKIIVERESSPTEPKINIDNSSVNTNPEEVYAAAVDVEFEFIIEIEGLQELYDFYQETDDDNTNEIYIKNPFEDKEDRNGDQILEDDHIILEFKNSDIEEGGKVIVVQQETLNVPLKNDNYDVFIDSIDIEDEDEINLIGVEDINKPIDTIEVKPLDLKIEGTVDLSEIEGEDSDNGGIIRIELDGGSDNYSTIDINEEEQEYKYSFEVKSGANHSLSVQLKNGLAYNYEIEYQTEGKGEKFDIEVKVEYENIIKDFEIIEKNDQ